MKKVIYLVMRELLEMSANLAVSESDKLLIAVINCSYQS